MQTGNTSQSSLLALLSGGTQTGAQTGLQDLQGAGLGLGEFSKILAGEGALNEISSKELLEFFQANMSKEGEASEIDFGKLLNSDEGKELLKTLDFDGETFQTKSGEVISPEQLLKKLAQSEDSAELLPSQLEVKGKKVDNSNKLASTEEFLAQRKALGNKLAFENNDGQPEIRKTNPGLHQYSKETKAFSENLIRPFYETSHLKESGDSKEGAIKDPSALTTEKGQLQNDLQAILSMGKGEQAESSLDGQSIKSETKVIDLSSINGSNKTEIMKKVSQYIEQAYVKGQDSIDLVVKHDELGHFRVNAQKVGAGQQIDLEISTMTQQGRQFFAENESELIKALTQNGVKLADVKFTNSSDLLSLGSEAGKSQTSEQNSSQSQGRGEQGSFGQNSRQQHSGSQSGQDRRRDMWQTAREFSESLSA